MRTLTVNLTTSLIAQWCFVHSADFERASLAACALLRERPMCDVDDLQALVNVVDQAMEREDAGAVSLSFIREHVAVVA